MLALRVEDDEGISGCYRCCWEAVSYKTWTEQTTVHVLFALCISIEARTAIHLIVLHLSTERILSLLHESDTTYIPSVSINRAVTGVQVDETDNDLRKIYSICLPYSNAGVLRLLEYDNLSLIEYTA